MKKQIFGVLAIFLNTSILAAQVSFSGEVTLTGQVSAGSQSSAPATLTGAVPSTFFGLHFKSSTPWPQVPFGSVRLWDSDTRWQQDESQPISYDFGAVDQYLSLAKSHGLRDILLTLSATPYWASSNPNDENCDYASTASGSCAPPPDINSDGTGTDQYWRDYIYNLAAHIASLDPNQYASVTEFAMWNEFTREQSSSPSSWLGTNAQLLRLVQDANCIITGRGPITATGQSCTVNNMREPAVGILGGVRISTPDSVLTAPQSSNYQSYLQTAGATGSADIIAVHGYVQNGTCCAAAETLISRMNTLKQILPASASALPIWSTEGSWGASQPNLSDPDLQAAFVARYYLIGWAQGFQRLYWYAYDNASWGTLWSPNGANGCSDDGSGLGCLTKAGIAYAQVYSWMVNNQMTSPCASAGTVWTCGFTNPDGIHTLAVWDTSQSCSAGVCGHSVFAIDPSYTHFVELDGSRAQAVYGASVMIGAKPILLER